MRLKIGSRKSDLARLQAQSVGALIQAQHPSVKIIYDFRESLGDKNLSDPLWKAPEKGLFTSDFVQGLESGELDLVVHSWKDLPIEDSPVRQILGTTLRADPRDVLLVKKNCQKRIQAGKSVQIFSSSPRREYCLKKSLGSLWPGGLHAVQVTSVRGNIPTRLRKLVEAPEIDGLVVAKAALDRLVMSGQSEFDQVAAEIKAILQQMDWMVLPLDLFPTAPAQGALGLEILRNRQDLIDLLMPIVDLKGSDRARKEREVLKSFGGGCHQKIGCSWTSGKSAQEVQFLVGLTDSGLVLTSPNHVLDTHVWSTGEWRLSKTRVPLDIDQKVLKAAPVLLVSKAEALPSDYDASVNQVIWCAGSTTWQKLAQRGLWVHGSAEGLGLVAPEISVFGDFSKTLHLTYQRESLPAVSFATYQVRWNSEPSERPQPGQKILIRSRMDFEMAKKLGLFLERPVVYCGMGETFLSLEKEKHLFAELIPTFVED